MNRWKIPPIEKIYEAYSAIADNRVTMKNSNSAMVLSSNKKKEYIVTFEDKLYTSNDNASFWQGYYGYPVIAVLMIQNKLSLDIQIANEFKNLNWNALNEKYKRNYTKVVEIVLNQLKENNTDILKIQLEVKKVFGELERLELEYKRSKKIK
ncbi:MAG: hypothetical protein RSG48_02555 [Clostridia bacterium]